MLGKVRMVPKIVLGIAKKRAISRKGPGLKASRKSWLKEQRRLLRGQTKLTKTDLVPWRSGKFIVMASGNATGFGKNFSRTPEG